MSLAFNRVKQIWNKILRPGALCWFWDDLTPWGERIQSCTGSTWQCSEHLCDSCQTWKSSRSAWIRLHSRVSFRGLCAWLSTPALYPGQPLVPGAKHFSPLWFHKVYIHLLSSSPPPSTLLLRNTSVVINFTSETWSSPGSNIITLMVL